MTEQVQEVLDIKAVEKQMLETHQALEGFIEKSNKEIEETKSASAETKGAIDKLSEKAVELADRLADMEQKQATRFEDAAEESKSAGELLVESEEFKHMLEHKRGGARVEFKTAIVNAPSLGMAQPLVAGDRLNRVWHEPNRVLRIRDVLPQGRTSSNVVFFPKENAFTNNAAVVRNTSASPIVAAENVTKPESALTFTSDSEEVVTIAHFIPISKQALDDSDFLASYVNNRLMYGLKLTEENQFLNGTGVTGYITGINTGATAYAQADSPNIYDDSLEYIRDMKRQAEQANYMPDVVVLNPKDYSDLELKREASNGQFIVGMPIGSSIGATLWGMRVVVSNSQSAGTATVFDSNTYQIFDREDAAVEISYEDSTNFQKNMATVRAEERCAFVCYSTSGTIKATI